MAERKARAAVSLQTLEGGTASNATATLWIRAPGTAMRSDCVSLKKKGRASTLIGRTDPHRTDSVDAEGLTGLSDPFSQLRRSIRKGRNRGGRSRRV